MKRIDDLEFRWSGTNDKYELIQWFKEGDKSFCMVIAFFDKTCDGCEIRLIGKRPFNVENNELVWAMFKYGQAIVDAEIILENL